MWHATRPPVVAARSSPLLCRSCALAVGCPPASLRTQRRLARVRASAGGQGDLPPAPDVAALAKMARLDVSAEEAAAWSPKIAAIVEWFGQLRDVDVTGVEPLPRGGEAGATPEELVLRLRPDEPANFAHREELLAAAANLEAPYLRIPKILDTDTD